ncbi:hypothetical protein F0L17_21090 [Streptomyces sp. TRM43335]|uniref:Uncharacterized protein n=1 Tax=Streptomyces taklimakanensis TaxID=2569853 RepID=A0A6G2BI43_9ACTN|nr:hypothetical protein [Streptomyces taklimakanensis]
MLGQEDPRVLGLRRAITRLHRELAGYRARLADRQIAEEELAAVETMAREGVPEVARLRGSLLLIAGAIGSVSALSEALTEVRKAVELFGAPPG